MITIRILVNNHRHQGHPVSAGTEIDVSEKTASWLIERGKAQAIEKTPAQTIETVAEEPGYLDD